VRAAVFLDRDGVLNDVVPDPRSGSCESPADASEVRLVPGAADAVRRLRAAGYTVVVVSNQPGAAKRLTTRAALDTVHNAVVRALDADGASIDVWRYCFHHPDAGDACDCRKPEPGLLVDAAQELGVDLRASWMVGDSDSDVEAGQRAGCRTALVLNPRSAHRRNGTQADVSVSTLADAARAILGGAPASTAARFSRVGSVLDSLRTKIFADGADLETILRLAENPRLRGFTTNPSLMWKAGLTDYAEFAQRLLAAITDRPVSFEVFADDEGEMRRQAHRIAGWGDNVYVKIPVSTTSGEPTAPLVRELTQSGIKLNVTALMTSRQVEAMATALDGGAPSIVSVFAGRIADAGVDPLPIMRESLAILAPVPSAELLWASPREVLNLVQASEIGCHIITMTNDLLPKLDGLGKDLDQFSLETVKMFHEDAVAAGFTL
jgi:transaldolase